MRAWPWMYRSILLIGLASAVTGMSTDSKGLNRVANGVLCVAFYAVCRIGDLSDRLNELEKRQ